MKRVLLSLVLVCIGLSAMAQANGLNPVFRVQINDLNYNIPKKKVTAGSVLTTIAGAAAGVITDTQYENFAPAVNAKVKSSLSKVRRLVALDSEDAIYDIVFSGDITQMSVTSSTEVRESKDSKGNVKKENVVCYDSEVRVTINVTFLPDGVVKSHNFKATGYSSTAYSSLEGSMNMAINELGDKITRFFNENFPIMANVVERGSDKNDKQKQLFIDVGALDGVENGMHFYIYTIGEIAGRETRKQIGKVVVNSVMGDDISLCKVQNGGKDIKIALDRDERILAVSKD